MTSINIAIGNIIEPRIEGKHLKLSPFIILISLSIWAYIWGFIGMILAGAMSLSAFSLDIFSVLPISGNVKSYTQAVNLITLYNAQKAKSSPIICILFISLPYKWLKIIP